MEANVPLRITPKIITKLNQTKEIIRKERFVHREQKGVQWLWNKTSVTLTARVNKCRFREIHENNRTASESYYPIRSNQTKRKPDPNVVGSACRHRLASSINVQNSRLFSCLLTLAEGRRQLPAIRSAFFYKSHCGLYELIFNSVKRFYRLPHLNTALSQIQIGHWRMRRKLVLQVQTNYINKHT